MRYRVATTFAAGLLSVLFALTGSASELPYGVVPVAGSTAGSFGGNFRTELQLVNPGATPISGIVRFHPQGHSGDASDPSLTFDLAAHATRSWADVVHDIGVGGLGSLDIIAVSGPLPVVSARAYDDGASGTKGVGIPFVLPQDALTPGQAASLLVPAHINRARMNVGVRTLDAGARIRFTRYSVAGEELSSVVRSYDPTWFEQRPAVELLGVDPGENSSIGVSVEQGSAIVYATMTDNRTNDPSFQLAERKRNHPPVVAPSIEVSTSPDQLVTITLSATDEDLEHLLFTILGSPSHGTLSAIRRIDDDTVEVDYTPASGFTGTDSFSFSVDDENGGHAEGSVLINVGTASAFVTTSDIHITSAGNSFVPVTLTGTSSTGATLTFTILTNPSHGTLGPVSPLSTTSARVAYYPNIGFSGTDSFTFRVSDGNGHHADGTVFITITAVNNEPTFTKGPNQTVAEDAGPQTIPNWATAIDEGAGDSGQTLDFIVTNNSNPSLFSAGPAVSPTGTLTYTPAPNASGSATITIVLHDNGGTANGGVDTSAPQTFTITVTPVNDAPVAMPDVYGVNEDTGLNVLASGVLGNDTDVESSPLTAILVSGPSHASSFTLNADGSFFYQAVANYNGSDSFTYKANDGSLDSNVVTVTITVTPVNDAPVAVADAYSTDEDVTLNVPAAGVLANDNDIDGNTLSAILVAGPSHASSFSLSPDGSFSYTPAANYNGSDSFTYKANDGSADSNTVTVSLTINAVNDAPVATADGYSTDEDTPLSVPAAGVLTNDSDPEGSSLTAILVSGPSHSSSFALNADGSFSYTPAADFNGSDSFTYKANDGSLDSNTVTVTITVNAVNDAPVAAADSYSTDEDTVLNVAAPGVLGNDTDVDGNSLVAMLVSGPSNVSSFTLNADGSFSYTPNANFNGTDSFTYKANDGTLDSNTVTVTITVNAVNDPPVAGDDSYTTAEDTPLTVPAPAVLSNDTDVESSPLAVTGYTQPAHGTVTVNADGSFTYTPSANYNGPDSFTYTVSDTLGASDTATVSITVTPVNDAPVAVADSYSTNEDTLLNVAAPGVLSNDVDIDSSLTAVLVSGPANAASFTLNPDGSFSYTPAANYNGGDSFTYKANDGSVDSNTVTVSITVSGVNDPPVAVADSYTVVRGGSLSIATPGVLANDTDPDSGTITAVIVASPSHASSFTLNPNGSFSYTNDGTVATTDSFTYKANDGTSDSNIVTVTITVTAANTPPVAVADAYNVAAGGTLTTTTANGVLNNDTDAEGTALTAILVSGPAHSSAFTLNPDGSFTYTNNIADSATSDSFTYKANDGQADSATVTVTLSITASNTAPVAVADSYSVTKGGTLNVSAAGVLANDTDANGDALSAVLVTNASHGSVTLNPDGGFTYVHNNDSATSDTFTYKANDGSADSNVATVTITIHASNNAPVAVNDGAPYTTYTDRVLNVAAPGVLANDTDADGDPLVAIVVSQPAHGSVTLSADGSFVYNPAPGYSGTDSFTYKANDGSADSNVATVSIDVLANAPPVVTTTAGTTAFTEDGGAVTIDGALTVTDGNDANLASATVTISNLLDSGAETLAATTAGTLITASYAAPTLTLSGSDTLANYQLVLRSVTYNNTSQNPSTTTRTINFVANDGIANSSTASKSVSVAGVNDAPVLTASGGSASFTENGGAVAVDGGITASDADNTNLTSATVTITNLLDATFETLAATTAGTSITASYVAPTLTLSGSDTIAHYQQVLRSITYNNSSENPTSTTRSISFVVSDGSASSNTATRSVTVTPVNDAPVITSTTFNVNENLTAAGTVTIIDPDGATPSFSITGGADQLLMSINSSTGALTFNSAPNYESGKISYSVDVQVSDGTATDTKTITITINDVNEAPIATTDPYDVLGNTQLEVKGATLAGVARVTSTAGVKDNDTDPDTNPAFNTLTITFVTGTAGDVGVPGTTTTTHGSVTLNADGSFVYVPTANYVGLDSFTYKLTDGTNTVVGTVNLTVSSKVWYVRDVIDAQNASGGDGRSTDAFETLTAAQSASGAGDFIFVFEGNTVATPLSAGIVLKDGQKLWGEAYGLNIAPFGQVVAAGLTEPRVNVTTPTSDAVSVPATGGNMQNVEIRGLDLQASRNAIDVTSSGANLVGVTITGNTVRGAGVEGIDLNSASTGAFAVTINNNTITSTGNGIDTKVSASGTATISASTNTISVGVAANGFDARTQAGASAMRIALDSTTVTAGVNGILIDGSAAGTTTITSFANNSLSGALTGNGMSVTTATFDVTPGGAFDQVSGGNTVIGASGAGNGVGLQGMILTSCSGDLAFTDLDIFTDSGTGLRASGPIPYTGSAGLQLTVAPIVSNIEAVNGPAVDLTTVKMALPFNSIKSTNSGTTGVALNSVLGTFAAGSGSSISGSSGTGFLMGSSNATVTYNGTLNTTTGKGVSLTTNSGSTISFTGTLTISSGSNAAFEATGGGTVSATDTASTLTSTTGIALNVANTTIGASGLKFRSITAGTVASGPSNGIILNTTGGSGSLTVLGNGGACSSVANCTGGAIQNTTGAGVSLTSTLSPSFTRLAIQNTAGSGVKGTTVTNFTFQNGFINNSATAAGADESNIAFNTASVGTENNLSGAVTILNNTLTNAFWHGIDILNFNGTISNATITGNTITSSTSTASSKGSGIRIQTLGSASTAGNLSAATISTNTITNFPSGAGISVQGGNSNASGPAGTIGTPGGSVVAITSNLIAGASAANKMGTSAILATVSGGNSGQRSQGNFNISSNGTVASPLANTAGTTIGCGTNGYANGSFTTSNNVIVSNNTVASNGVGGGTGVVTGTSNTPDMTWTITGNSISATDGNGILAVARGATGFLKVKIQNNTVAAPLSGVREGIRVDAGNGSSIDDAICLNISGNTSAGSGGTVGIGLRKQGTSSTTNDFGVNGMSATSGPGVTGYVDGLNPAGGGTVLISANAGFSNCSLP